MMYSTPEGGTVMSRKVSKAVRWIVFLSLVLGGIAYLVYQNGSRRAIRGLSEPIQEDATGSVKIYAGDWKGEAEFKASYEVDALVVHRKKYSGGPDGAFSPVDLALAWGRVAEYNKAIDFHWSQSGRWYMWRTNDLDDLIPVGDVENVDLNSANTHIIPANNEIKKKVLKIRRGDHVKLKGYLVYIEATNGRGETFTWHSSLSREDTGDGACEVFYVTEARIV